MKRNETVPRYSALKFIALTAGFLVGLGIFSTASAEIAGFEQLLNVSADCPESELAVPEQIGKFSVCPYRMIKCQLKEDGKPVFTGYVTIDCEKPSSDPCPKIDKCAQLKMRSEVADAVRQANDPNNSTDHVDGHSDPLAKEKKDLGKVPQ